MKVTVQCSEPLATLAGRYSCFDGLHGVHIESTPARRWGRGHGSHSHDLSVVFLGKTGYGKSSLVNTLIGKTVMQTSNVEACTRGAQCADFLIRPGHYLSFIDMPGIGESGARDAEYMVLYESMIAKSDVVVYVVRADCRDYSVDSDAFTKLAALRLALHQRKVLVALNCCDKIEPMPARRSSQMSSDQLVATYEKVRAVNLIFSGTRSVVPCSADLPWNMEPLAISIFKALTYSQP